MTVTAVNDEPSLTATASNPTFTEDGPAVALYSGTAINLVETADKVKTLVLTVSGLQNGASEVLVVDGTDVALTQGTSGTTTTRDRLQRGRVQRDGHRDAEPSGAT